MILAVSTGAGVINSLVGGGTTIVLPLLVFCGVPPLVANGTNRLAVACQSLAALASLRSAGALRWRAALPLAAAALAGGIVGSLFAKAIDEERFQSVMGWILLGGIPLLFVRGAGGRPGATGFATYGRFLLALGGALLCGVYGGFLGAGVGALIMIFLTPLAGMTPLEMLPVKILMVLAMSVSAAAVFLSSGLVDWRTAAPLIAGNVLGGVIGARVALAAGDRLLRIATAAIGAALAVLLILELA